MAKALQIISALIRYDNSDVEGRDYDIAADFHLIHGEAGNVENGSVRKDGNTVAIFSFWDGNKSATYYNLTDEEEHSVNVAVKNFISTVSELAPTQQLSL